MSVSTTKDGTLLYRSPNGVLYVASGNDANCTLPACPVELSVYGYRASLPFSSTLIALYSLCILVQVWMGWRYKTWSYMTAMLLGCFSEILGYAGRIMMWENPWNHVGFIMQIVLITIAPVFFSAAIYFMLHSSVRYISVSMARFPPRLFYWIFIPCDVVSLILQATGGAMSSTSNGKSETGVNIALAGLAFQVFTLVVFIIACADYAILSKNAWRGRNVLSWNFKIFAVFLGLATILILARCSYRVYELSGGYSRDSPSLRDQSLFIGLEGVMVIVAAWCLVGSHPGPVFNKSLDRPISGVEMKSSSGDQ